MTLTAPVQASERVDWIDALRGFALLGIIVANLESSMLRFMLPDKGHGIGPLAALNVPFEMFQSALIEGKFYSIFSFLFGLGFSIQMMRAYEGGAQFSRFFRRRLTALLIIGIVHAFVWLGDILTLYALCGFALLPFRSRSDRTLLTWAFGLLLAPVGVYALVAVATAFVPLRTGGSGPPFDMAQVVRWMTHGTLWDYFSTNAFGLLFRWFDLVISLRPAKVMGMFLLGLWTGRRMLHTNLESQRRLLVRLATIAMPVGLLGGALLAWADQRGLYYQPGPTGVVYAAIYCIGTHVLAIGYIATFLLCWTGRLRPLLARLQPVGRLALSNYLFQTLCIVALLYAPGLGLALDLPVWSCLPIGCAIYAVQSAISRLWLRDHRYGPAERIWRTMTYGRNFDRLRA